MAFTWNHPNGRFPLSAFIHRGDNIYLTPSLNARWNELVRLALEKYGVRLWITGDIDGLGGWNGYRPWAAQGAYKRHYGRFAAAQGYSSHGGRYNGQIVFALDVANLDALAPHNASLARARLTSLAKAVGLRVNFVTPTEWWHLGDFNSPGVVPRFGHVAINPKTTNKPAPEPDQEEDTMKVFGYKNPKDGRVWYVTMDFAGGLWDEFVTTDKDYAVSVAKNWGGGAPLLSVSHRDGLAEKFNLRWPELASMTER